jgi:hypothetical protein
VSWSQTNLRNYVPNKVQQMLDKTFGNQELQIDKEIKKPELVQNQESNEGFEIGF